MKLRHTWRFLHAERGVPSGWAALNAYVQVTARLYRAIADVTGARVLVDSSKRPARAALLHLLPGVEAYFLHLVRDPRAVAYSWQRRSAQPDSGERAELIPHGPVDSTIHWLARNIAAEGVRRHAAEGHSLLLRYEDLVSQPRKALGEIVAMVGEKDIPLPLVDGDKAVRLRPNHTVSGNPSRFATGVVKLRCDEEWVARIDDKDQLLATLVAAPLLHRYRYSAIVK